MKKLILLSAFLIFACSSDEGKRNSPNRLNLKIKKNSLDKQNINGRVHYIKETGYSAVEKSGEPEWDEFMWGYTIYYDKDGFETEWQKENAKGEIVGLTKFEYDEDGNLSEGIDFNTESEYFEVNGIFKAIGHFRFSSDNNGNVTERYYYNNNGQIQNRISYKYDANGNKIEQIFYSSSGDGSDEKLLLTTNFKYGRDGRVAELKSYDDNQELNQTAKFKYYEFDNKKNWQKKIYYEDGKAIQIIDRKIIYYEEYYD